MNNRIVFSVFFLVVILFIGCKKDSNKYSVLKIGDSNNMIVNYYDTTLVGEINLKRNFAVDVNNDGVKDIMFECIIWSTPSIGKLPTITTYCLNKNVEFFGFSSQDSMFLNLDTVYQNPSDIEVLKIMNINKSCERISNKDSILNISPSFNIFPLNYNDIMKISSGEFKSDTIRLINSSYISPPVETQNGDTTIIENNGFLFECKNFPISKEKYIGFRENGKLGWVKISILDKKTISIHESAVQE